jgi:hypothetical protein
LVEAAAKPGGLGPFSFRLNRNGAPDLDFDGFFQSASASRLSQKPSCPAMNGEACVQFALAQQGRAALCLNGRETCLGGIFQETSRCIRTAAGRQSPPPKSI